MPRVNTMRADLAIWTRRFVPCLLRLALTLCGTFALSQAHALLQPETPEQLQLRLQSLEERVPLPQGSRYTTREWDWTDESRHRAIPVKLHLPNPVPAGQRVPMVVLVHGLGGSRSSYVYLSRFWAAHGFAVLQVQHVGSDERAWYGNLFGLIGRLQHSVREQEVIARMHDLRFALDRLLAMPELPIDVNRIAMAGHSFGALTSLMAAGARIDRETQSLQFRDNRIGAIALMGAPFFTGEKDQPGIVAHIKVPSLHITAKGDSLELPGYFSSLKDRLMLHASVGSSQKGLVVFKGGDHTIWGDDLDVGGIEINASLKIASRELVLVFLRQIWRMPETEPDDLVDLRLSSWQQRHAPTIDRMEFKH
jgi:dienelactone hydrolase